MKRDWDVIREILQKAEELEPNKYLELENFSSDTAYEVSYNIRLLYDAGLIDAEDVSTNGDGPDEFFVFRLTWNGHEFLDSIRSDSVWKKTKDKIVEKGGVMTFDVVKAVALGFVKSSLGL